MQSWPSRRLKVFFLTLACGCIGTEMMWPGPADAMHETDHRFTVSGYVRDKDGTPVGDARVYVRDLRDQKIEGVTTYTDRKGYYKAVLHLHNDNAGDPLQISVREEKVGLEDAKDVRAEFNPRDAKTERQAKINFGPSLDQDPDAGDRTWSYVAGGVLIGTAALAAVMWGRRKRATESKRRRKKR